jgi:hypothetical protein
VVLAVVGQIACGLEYGNGGWVSGALVAVDDPRFRMVLTTQGSREKEVDRRTLKDQLDRKEKSTAVAEH